MSYGKIVEQLEPPSVLLAGDKTVAAAATPEVLVATSTLVKNSVIIQAKSTNTGAVYVGDATNQDVELNALDSVVVVCDNLNLIYIKVAVNGEGVNFVGG